MPPDQTPANDSAAAPKARADKRPVRSMTGYAHRSTDTPLGRVTMELRSVNSRFTDLQFRLAEDLRFVEPMLRERITAVVSRGKIECRIQMRSRDADSTGIQINDALIASLVRAEARIRALAPDAAPLTVADYLRWQMAGTDNPGSATLDGANAADAAVAAVASGAAAAAGPTGTGDDAPNATGHPADRVWPVLEPTVDLVLAEFVASREREGSRLASTIVEQVDQMKQVVVRLQPMIPELLAGAEARLAARLEEAMPESTGAIPREETFARVRQEIALLSLRGDVTEEFDRLTIHFEEVLRALDQGGPIGKRLDFLTQELNRESNTIASKANGVALTDGVVALKLLIEQMREQVQNIE